MNILNNKKGTKKFQSHLVDGSHSETIKELQRRIDACPLQEVQKMQLTSMLEDMTAKSIAFDIDKFVKLNLIQSVTGYDTKVLSYQSDMIDTQRKIAERENDILFHKKVVTDLKQEYLDTKNKELLKEIDERERAINELEKLYNNLLDLRNKMRKELDKKMYQERTLKLQEEDHEKKMNEKTIEINTEALDL